MYGRSDSAQGGATGKVPGIAPDMQAHPFEKYRTGLNGPHGAGRGLYLAMGPARRIGDDPCAQNLPGAGAAVSSALLFSQRTVPCFSAKPGPAESGSPPSGQQRNSTRCLPRKRVPGHGRAQKHSPFQRPVHHGRQPAAPGFCCGRKRQFALYFIGKIMYSRSENKAENM